MPTAAELNERFAIHDHVSFHDHLDESGHATGLVEARIETPLATATLFLQGAHLARWTPADQQPVLYLSPRSNFAPGKAIRGGIPVLFPWFGDGWDGQHKPAHGFARSTDWTLDRTHLDHDGIVHLALSLGPDDKFRAAGYDHFRVGIEFSIGTALTVTLDVANDGTAPMEFEEGLHTYFAVGDIHQVATEGLEGTTYIDKRDANTRKVQRDHLLRYTRDVDQVHVQTTAPLTIHDAAWQRDILITKEGSATTVTWNPWSTLTPGLADLSPDAWEHFVCVEAVNSGDDRLTLAPGASHRMACTVAVSSHA